MPAWYNYRMAKKLIVANWKENPKTPAAAMRLFDASARAAAKVRTSGKESVEMVICPPSIFLEKIAREALPSKLSKTKKLTNLALGAQDVFWEDDGPFTGGVGPKILRTLSVKYVIVGHSERRKWFGETDAMINKKVLRTLADGLHVILCVGEPLAVRKNGIGAAKRYLKAQLICDLKGVFGGEGGQSKRTAGAGKIIVAYEPIWAIGSGRNDDPKDAVAIAAFIKETVYAFGERGATKGKANSTAGIKVLYGGSVNSKNVADYVQLEEIDGALVGGASLKADEFGKLMKAAAQN
jgi:triosephosphate isomerase